MEYYSAIKKEQNFAICKNMDGLGGHYAKWNKKEKDKYYMILLNTLVPVWLEYPNLITAATFLWFFSGKYMYAYTNIIYLYLFIF